MKKILIVVFLAIIMLMAPITTATQAVKATTSNVDPPQFFITVADYAMISYFIETNFEDGEEKNLAKSIRDDIISENLEINITALADAAQEYGFQKIPEDELLAILDIEDPEEAFEELNLLIYEYWNIINGELIKDLFGQLIDKIIELVKDRLGWVHEFLDRSVTLFVDGVNLAINYIKPAVILIAVSVVLVINDILSIPNLFSELLNKLFELEFQAFIGLIIDFIEVFANDFAALIQNVKNLVNNETIKNYLTDLQGFFTWLDGKPWQDQIEISGVVRKIIGGPLVGATITCRGETTTTDSNGRYSFKVNPSNTADDSFPAYEWYGMHNCTITVSKDGEVLKQTPFRLSYSFSGGKIDWSFLVLKGKSAAASSSSSASSSSTSSSASSSSSSSSPMLNTYNTQGTNTYSSPNIFPKF